MPILADFPGCAEAPPGHSTATSTATASTPRSAAASPVVTATPSPGAASKARRDVAGEALEAAVHLLGMHAGRDGPGHQVRDPVVRDERGQLGHAMVDGADHPGLRDAGPVACHGLEAPG